MPRALILTVATLVAFASGADAQRPNVLIILADDLGHHDVGFTGSTEIHTPRLDELAAGGVVVRNGYVTHPYCGPSRAGLLTGRHQARFGMEINPTYSPYDLYSGLPLTERTFGDRLQEVGYRTGVIGKWHLGASEPFHPNNRGFDYFYGFLSGGHRYFPQTVTTHFPLLLENGEPHYSANEGAFLPLTRNMGAAEFDEYLTTALSRDAAEFVTKSKGPFCLYLAYNAPHAPYEAPAKTIERYGHIKDKTRRIYAAMIDEMDRGIGIVVDALRDSDKLDNTLIFFLSDNGGVQTPAGEPAIADNSPFRKGKGSMFEGGSHVPFLLHWPAGLPAGVTFDGLVSSLDIAATAVALAGGEADGDSLEGVNLIPYLKGEKKGSPHDALFWRKRDGSAWSVRTPDAKYLSEKTADKRPPPYGAHLFDMERDPYESEDLRDAEPGLRESLAKLWNDWNADNSPCVFLEAPEYQKTRLSMYKQLHQRLVEEAAAREPVVIE